MKLTCPNCGAGFEVRAEALGPTGRKVRCSACGYQWTAQAGAAALAARATAPVPREPVAAAPAAAPPPPEPTPFPEPLAAHSEPAPPEPLEPATATEAELPDIAALREAAVLRPSAPQPPPRADYVAAPPPQERMPPPTRVEVRPPRHWGALVGWVLLVAVLVGLGGAVVLREDVIAAFPQSREAYRVLGFNVPRPGSDLDIVDTRPTWSRSDGQPTLIIEGRVKNMSNAARDIPQLRAVLRNGAVDVQSWTFTASASSVPAGGEVPFRTEARAPPAATTVVVVFALGD
jgi:predicted Zn finger-like uncharacterized protein